MRLGIAIAVSAAVAVVAVLALRDDEPPAAPPDPPRREATPPVRPPSPTHPPLDRFAAEKDPHALQELATSMRGDEAAVDAMIEAARHDPLRREAALLFLCGARDPDGRVGALLREHIDIVLHDLPLFLRRNPEQADAFHAWLLDSDRLVGVEPSLLSDADRGRVERIAAAAESAESRAGAYDLLGRSPPETADRGLPLLSAAFRDESDGAARSTALLAILRLGRDRALPILTELRPHAGDLADDVEAYLAILEERPDIPFDELLAARRDR